MPTLVHMFTAKLRSGHEAIPFIQTHFLSLQASNQVTNLHTFVYILEATVLIIIIIVDQSAIHTYKYGGHE